MGGVLGFIGSLGIVWLAGFVPMQDFVGTPTISPAVGIVTLSLLGTIGLLAGLFPARKAAGLDPVECLRY
jgi:putative ABC transport system permease protein